MLEDTACIPAWPHPQYEYIISRYCVADGYTYSAVDLYPNAIKYNESRKIHVKAGSSEIRRANRSVKFLQNIFKHTISP
uniref:Uncharacterized protein n=1 Tax=Pararge aegeria TaxID=116150 RepID=S4P8D0_9NEOP